MIDLRKEENKKLVYKLFKTWRWKAVPRIKKSKKEMKWNEKRNEKEIVHQKQSPGGILKKVFLKVSQNSQVNTCARTFPVAASGSQLHSYKESRKNVLKINLLLLRAILLDFL